MTRAEMVTLKPDGTCPECGAHSSAGRKPRKPSKPLKRTYCASCGNETGPGDIRPWACSSQCYADIMGIYPPNY